MTLKSQEGSRSTASAFPLLPYCTEQHPVLGAGEVHAGLGLELGKGSPEYAQSEIWDLETKAPEGKGQSFKQKAFPFPRQC